MILFQFRLLAGDLADTSIFTAALLCGFIVPVLLARRNVRTVPALVILGLIPWTVRLFISLPRFFSGTAVFLDSLLLNLDRNTFVSLLPYYWAAAATYGAFRSRSFLRADIVAGAVLLLITFSAARTADIELYRWPVVMIAVFAAIAFMQAAALMLSIPPGLKLRRAEAFPAAAAFLVLILLGAFLFLKPSQEGAVDQGGGLLEPRLFNFDFSQVLKLENEIKMNNDLVLVMKKDPGDQILTRRYSLSGYNKKQGFFRLDDIDEKVHPAKIPGRRTVLDSSGIKPNSSGMKPNSSGAEEFPQIRDAEHLARIVNQEYYLVNFDSSAFVAMNKPLEVIPFETWDNSSFNSAYAVQSLTSDVFFFELFDAPNPDAEALGLSPDEYRLYTEYGGDQRLRAYAEEITRGLSNYGEKVQAIHDRLKFGEYRYSLKPGIAPDGDQLSWFLFESKKGYCSYYAFAMTLLLRSLGIPARVAAGFFINPEENTFDYFPVRANMAHSWVEVPYPGYGWIEYDPTTTEWAAGEELRFGEGDQELFDKLMKEILENHSRFRPKEETADEADQNTAVERVRALVKRYFHIVILFLLVSALLLTRCVFFLASLAGRRPRKKAILLWKHAKRRLGLAGLRKSSLAAEAEWARDLDNIVAGTYAIYQGAAAARFAPEFTPEDLAAVQNRYHAFNAAYKKAVSAGRRLLAWVLPPLALVLKHGRKSPAALFLALLLSLSFVRSGAQTGFDPGEIDAFYNQALEAITAEHWERAVELLSRGSENYPWEPRFPWTLGDLYFGRGLYTPAWDAYRKAEILVPGDPDILFRLSRAAAYLNRDTLSVSYLEKVLAITPDNREAIGNLGWMYYKVHRLEEGRLLLLNAVARFGVDADFAMTLGTLYSEMFNYDEGKKWYLTAIAGGEEQGDRVFTAVAHYNLSILESRFYRYALAHERANMSIRSHNRASGRLARGELYLRRLNISQAISDFEAAYEVDTSPLSKINLAQVFQISGRLEEARLYAEDCLRGGDLSWMLNYGIDPVRYRRDIHDILRHCYAGLEKTERLSPYGRPGEKIRSLFRGAVYRFKAGVHRRLYRKYSLAAADAYGAMDTGGDYGLDALIQYYNAFEEYPRRAAAYLEKARAFETAIIPAAAPSFDLEEGILGKNPGLVLDSLDRLDPVWEQDMIARGYAFLAERTRDKTAPEFAEELFTLNRGALRQEGILLPAEVHAIPARGGLPQKKLLSLLKKGGVSDSGSRFILNITQNPGQTVSCELYDNEKKTTLFNGTFPLASLSNADLSDFVRALTDAVFRE